MSTTLKDFGRHSERFGDIPFYYAFPIKFWFEQHMLIPEDVLTWCRENCTGCYKVVQYTHKDSRKTVKTTWKRSCTWTKSIWKRPKTRP